MRTSLQSDVVMRAEILSYFAFTRLILREISLGRFDHWSDKWRQRKKRYEEG